MSKYVETTVAGWQEWMDRILLDLQEVLVRRRIWREMTDQLLASDVKDVDYFEQVWVRMYVDSQSAAVRRHADVDPDSVSLARLLTDVQGQAQLLTRELWVRTIVGGFEQWTEEWEIRGWEAMQNFAFDQFAGDGGTHVDPDAVKLDLERLQATTSGVVHFATRTVAHLDKRGLRQDVTFGSL